MNIIRRLELLEAATRRARDDVRYEIVLLKKGESSEEGIIIRWGLQDWPQDRIICVNFVSPSDKPTSNPLEGQG